MDEERTRKANLESTISETPNARGYYEAKVWMGTKADGKPDRRHVQRKTLAGVRKRVRELERDRDAGRIRGTRKVPTVRQMLEYHLDTILPSRKRSPKTIDSYRSLCKNDIYPRWGGQRADRLLPEHVEQGIASMRKAGLADSSIRKIYAVLSSAYAVQVKRGNLITNPCAHVEPPEVTEGEMPSLTNDQALRVMLAAADRLNAARWTVGLGCGLRQGEALGLRWSFLNLDTGEMRIWWQLQRLLWQHGCEDAAACTEGKHRRPCPKKCPKAHRKSGRPHQCITADAPRLCPPGCTAHASTCPERRDGGLVLRPIKEKRHKTVWLAEEWTELLRKHRDEQYLQKLTADAEWEDHDLVFCQWNGRPIDPRRDWAEWGAILTAAGLPRHRVHSMRHSAASFAIAEGVAIPVVQQMLGHSDIRVTQKYTHVGKALAQDASGRTARALGLSKKAAE